MHAHLVGFTAGFGALAAAAPALTPIAKYTFNNGKLHSTGAVTNSAVLGTLATPYAANCSTTGIKTSLHFDAVPDAQVSIPAELIDQHFFDKINFAVSMWVKVATNAETKPKEPIPQRMRVLWSTYDTTKQKSSMLALGTDNETVVTASSYAMMYTKWIPLKPKPTPYATFPYNVWTHVVVQRNDDIHVMQILTKDGILGEYDYTADADSYISPNDRTFTGAAHGFNFGGAWKGKAQLGGGWSGVWGDDVNFGGLLDNLRLYAEPLTFLEIEDIRLEEVDEVTNEGCPPMDDSDTDDGDDDGFGPSHPAFIPVIVGSVLLLCAVAVALIAKLKGKNGKPAVDDKQQAFTFVGKEAKIVNGKKQLAAAPAAAAPSRPVVTAPPPPAANMGLDFDDL